MTKETLICKQIKIRVNISLNKLKPQQKRK